MLPPWIRVILASAVLLLLFLLFSGEIRDTDVFWHLRTGQYIAQKHQLPAPDPFSYNSTGISHAGEDTTRQFNLTHEWLAQLIMFTVFSIAGFPGLVLARILLLVLFCAIAGWLAYRRTGGFLISLAASLGAAGMAFYFAQSRPFLASFVFLAVTLTVLETRRWLWCLPPLFLVWANCHGGFIVGWAACLAYCAEALVAPWRTGQDHAGRKLWLVTAVSIAVSGINPNGFRILPVLIFYRVSGIQTTNLEWQKPIFWTPGLYSFLLFGTLIVLLLAWRRVRPADWLLYAILAGISLTAVRNTIFLGLVAPFLMATYLPRKRILGGPLAAIAAAGLLFFELRPATSSGNTLAFRAAEWQFPAGAASFIQEHHLTARMFNHYEAGGYLIWRLWPAQEVFIDSRGLNEAAFADYRKILYDTSGGKTADALLRKYGIDMLVLEGFDYLSGQVYPVAVDAAASSDWKLVYGDSQGVIFLRNPPPDVKAFEPRSALLSSLAAQCEEHLRHEPARPRCAFGLGELFAFRGDSAHARQWMARYQEQNGAPDKAAEEILQSLNVTALNEQANTLQARGKAREAEPLLRQAVVIAQRSLGPEHPDTAGALNNLATLLESLGNYGEAESLFRQSLAICEKKFGVEDPRTAMALDNLAGVLEAKGDANAEDLYRRALAIAQRTLGPGEPEAQAIQQDLENFLRGQRGKK